MGLSSAHQSEMNFDLNPFVAIFETTEEILSNQYFSQLNATPNFRFAPKTR